MTGGGTVGQTKGCLAAIMVIGFNLHKDSFDRVRAAK